MQKSLEQTGSSTSAVDNPSHDIASEKGSPSSHSDRDLLDSFIMAFRRISGAAHGSAMLGGHQKMLNALLLIKGIAGEALYTASKRNSEIVRSGSPHQ